MDKILLLQAFARTAVEQSLDADLVRLFLLLLAGGGREGYGVIGLGIVRKALGPDLSPEALKTSCQALASRNLIEVIYFLETFSPLELTVRYRLLPIGGHFICSGGNHD